MAGCILLAAVLSSLICWVIFWRINASVSEGAKETAMAVGQTFQKALNFTPEVRVNTTIVVAQTTPVLELVTAERKALVQHRWEHTWMHSTKNFEIEATFTAKAGFDLREPFRLIVDSRSGAVTAELSKVKLLSLSMGDVRVLRDEDGVWNKLTAADREEAFRALEAEARRQFLSSNLLAQAGNEIDKRIREIVKDIPPQAIPLR